MGSAKPFNLQRFIVIFVVSFDPATASLINSRARTALHGTPPDTHCNSLSGIPALSLFGRQTVSALAVGFAPTSHVCGVTGEAMTLSRYWRFAATGAAFPVALHGNICPYQRRHQENPTTAIDSIFSPVCFQRAPTDCTIVLRCPFGPRCEPDTPK